MTLDKLDLRIIEELEDDARQPVPVLAKKLGMAKKMTTVRYRLSRLLSERVLTIVCIGDPELFGYQFLVVIGINVAPGKAQDIANQLSDLSIVKFVALSVGRYNILAWGLFRDRSSLSHFISENLACMPDIKSFEMMLSYEWIKSYWKYFKPQTKNVRRSEDYNLNNLDLAIIRAVQQDPRQSITDLAKTVGCSGAVAKRRLDKLLKEEAIKFACIITPSSLGWDGMAVVMLIESEPNKIHAIADELSGQDPARLVSLIAGEWHIFFGATFTDSEHMHSFLSETLDFIPGIVKYEIIHLTDILKYDLSSIDWAE